MSKVKDLLNIISVDDANHENELEVYADSIKQALELAATELNVDVASLDYEVVEKGTKGFLGFGRQPYKLYVHPEVIVDEFAELSGLDTKLSQKPISDIKLEMLHESPDGSYKVRVTKTGIWLTVTPAKKKGKPVKLTEVKNRIDMMRIENYDMNRLEKEVARPSAKPVRLGDWFPQPEFDGSMHVEVAENEMAVHVHFNPPRFSGRHMDLEDVLNALKRVGVVVGTKEERISEYLEQMDYSRPLLAAEGLKAKHGNDAYIEYKVRIENEVPFGSINDDKAIDYKELNLIENVVVGQVLAVKIPAEKGVQGRTVTNRILAAKSGTDVQIKYGKGTILSDDGMELTAEKNGQVVMKAGKISVDEVLVIQGDVDNTTGNVVMLGSVMVTGSVLDNFIVKASGNIEVRGSVQKAFLEAEGDIIVRQGINGRDGAKIETTGGSVFAKFIQRSRVIAEKNIIVSEEVLHCHADAGKLIFCNGRRAQIVGGVIRAGDEINAKQIGGDSYTRTELRVGMNPKVLQQMNNLQKLLDTTKENKEKIEKDIHTLENKKKTQGALPAEQEELLNNLTGRVEKYEERYSEVALELEELNSYLDMLEQKGKVCAQKTLFPGVEVYMKNEKLRVNDPYSDVKITLEGDDWRFDSYETPEGQEPILSLKSRRRR
jgi:uncharacterized protein (DUF342 family)